MRPVMTSCHVSFTAACCWRPPCEGAHCAPPLTFPQPCEHSEGGEILWKKRVSSRIHTDRERNPISSFCLCLPSLFAAPSLISELRAEKIEQKSITLVWRQPSYPNSSRTEYEVKYYEKVKTKQKNNCVEHHHLFFCHVHPKRRRRRQEVHSPLSLHSTNTF